ncbi:MAG: hypothetical protein ACKO5K_09720 [Armatimonadota bacterium]
MATMLQDRWVRAVAALVLAGATALLVYEAGRNAGLREADARAVRSAR